jgi:hypothetical protein
MSQISFCQKKLLGGKVSAKKSFWGKLLPIKPLKVYIKAFNK